MQPSPNVQDLSQEIFTKHSVTYSLAAKLFPKPIQRDVALLYAFVRLADEFVDNPVDDPKAQLGAWRDAFHAAWEQVNSVNPTPRQFSGDFSIIPPFCAMANQYGFEKFWIDAFFDSMEQDISPRRYETWEELMEYVFGSAEVIGLMMTRLMGTPEQHDEGARALGASMQLINFLRDVREDHDRDRLYIPLEMLAKHDLHEADLWDDHSAVPQKKALAQEYIARIDKLQLTAETSFVHLPKGCIMPVRLASDAYKHTLQKIRRDPLIAFRGAPKNHAGDIAIVAFRTLISQSMYAVQGKTSA